MMSLIARFRWRTRAIFALTVGTLFALVSTSLVFANVAITRISSDPYTNPTSYHATEVEPDTFSFGSTIVAAFQVGRFTNGGASNIGFATSNDGGATWTHGFLPGTTVFATPAGIYPRASDPSVAFDATHGVWMISWLGLFPNGTSAVDVLVSRSTDASGTAWSPTPAVVNADGHFNDKNWTTCDNGTGHPGNCYTEFDDHSLNNQLHMSTSTDGGVIWRDATVPHALVIGGQPVVQPSSGTVVVPIDNAFEATIESFVSIDGGKTYSGPFLISHITSHRVAGDLRTSPLPSARVDAAGKVYVVWQDCRFEIACPANDIVLSTSTDGTNWTAVTRIPINAVGSGVDHFIPGLAVNIATSGSSAQLGLTYYFYPVASCTTSTCQLDVGFISSGNGGSSWNAPTMITGPMTLTSLPLTTQGFMVGDYISTSFNNTGTAHGVFAVATVGTTCTLGEITSCNEAMFTNASGLAVSAGSNTSSANVVVTSAPGSSVPLTAF
jgi:hypothetical protein